MGPRTQLRLFRGELRRRTSEGLPAVSIPPLDNACCDFLPANLKLLRALAVASVDITCGRRGRVPRRAASARRAGAGGGPRALGRLTISATDWSERRWSVTVSPRRICRNTAGRWIAAAWSHAPRRADRASRTAHLYRTAHLFPARALLHGDLRCCLPRRVGPYGPGRHGLRIRVRLCAGVESVAYERMF